MSAALYRDVADRPAWRRRATRAWTRAWARARALLDPAPPRLPGPPLRLAPPPAPHPSLRWFRPPY